MDSKKDNKEHHSFHNPFSHHGQEGKDVVYNPPYVTHPSHKPHSNASAAASDAAERGKSISAEDSAKFAQLLEKTKGMTAEESKVYLASLPKDDEGANIMRGNEGYMQDGKKPTSKKRKSENVPEVDLDSIEIPDGTPMDLNANQIRTRIRTFINSGEMKVGEFQNKIDVSANSYSAFMKQSGPNHGIYSKTYYNAFEFFKKRELAGLKMPRKKAKTSDTKAAAAKGKAATTDDPGKFDVGDIKLEGEERECVPIFDTCDDVRKKINAHLREPDITNAGFLREIGKTFPSPPSQGMSVASLRTFLSANGSDKHSHSPIFYAGYVYFEKLRLKNKKAKSAKRTEMEKIWPKGFDRTKHSGYIFMGRDETAYTDQYGRTHFSKKA